MEAAVTEQIARMAAMRSANENATEMIRKLTVQYNRTRQSQITTELAEILGGSVALEN
jgi:F-type H+-transporting ATPase subunit gamma